MSEPVEASSSSESSSSSNNVEGDPGIAWEERRKAWLTPNEKGKRRATQATIDRLSSVLAYDSNIQTQEAAAERSGQTSFTYLYLPALRVLFFFG